MSYELFYRALSLLIGCVIALGASEVSTGASATPAIDKSGQRIGYRLGAGDLLRFEVFDHPDLAISVRIPETGSFSYPLIGEVTGVIDRTVEEIAIEVRRRLETDYVRKAEMNVVILEYAPRAAERVYVLGQVRNPNALTISRDERLTVSRAITLAGGFDVSARRDQVNLVRDGVVRIVDLNAVMAGTPGAEDPVMVAGDQVLVPTQDRIYIMGRVRLVGAYAIPPGEKLTVSRAVIMAGGFDEFARQDNVQLVRNGAVTLVNVKTIVAGAGGADPELQAGDTIMVPESRF